MTAQRLAVIALSLVLLGGAAPVGASAVPLRNVDGDLAGALARHDRVRVIVALRMLQPARPARTFAGLVSSAVQARAGLLARVRPSDGFRATARWDAVMAVPGLATRAGVARLAADPAVLRVGLDAGGGGALGDRDSALIGADVAHVQGFTGKGVNVAVIDSGVAETHADLRTSLIGEHCFVVPSGCPNGASEQDGPGSAIDQNGHGTNVSGIVTSDGTVAPLGVAPASGLVAVRVLDAQGRFQTLGQIVSALNWVATARPDVRVVNMSLGTDAALPGTCDQANASTLAMASAVNALRARGTLTFAASGNSGLTGTMPVPACIAAVVAVGAVHAANLGVFFGPCTDVSTAPDKVACFSNSDSALDLLGPGVSVVSTGFTGTTSTYTGTSQATPHAAGAAALLLQAKPTLSAADLERLLESTGKPVLDPRNGLTRPRIDIPAALRSGPVPTPGIQLTPSTRAFGRVRIGSARTLSLTVRSVGSASLSVRMVNQPGGFVVRPRTLTLLPGTTGSIAVTFRPRAVRAYTGSLIVSTNAPAAAQLLVRLSGTGRR